MEPGDRQRLASHLLDLFRQHGGNLAQRNWPEFITSRYGIHKSRVTLRRRGHGCFYEFGRIALA